MGEAIVRAIIRAGVVKPEFIVAADPSPERRELFERELRVRCVERAADAAAEMTVLLAVKPQQMGQVLREIEPVVLLDALVISIAAGISTAFIDRALGAKQCRIVR